MEIWLKRLYRYIKYRNRTKIKPSPHGGYRFTVDGAVEFEGTYSECIDESVAFMGRKPKTIERKFWEDNQFLHAGPFDDCD